VLAKVGARLKLACRNTSALVARLGGDEFAIMLSGNGADGAGFARKLVESLKQPFAVGGLEISVGASAGIAEYPQHGEDSHALLRAADVAMYQAKQRGLGVCLYDVRFDDYSTERLALVSELNDALQNRELVLFYQPKVDIATGEPVGFEALARWQHPRLGLLDPADFIDLVEMSEIVHPFTQEVLRLAITGNQYLQRHGWQLPVAINLSPRNLQDSQFFTDLQATLEAHAIAPSSIEIEITETALMLEPEHAVEVLGRLNALGVHIAIDDFGTGYSSLRRLRHLPVQSLKIDRSFVTDMASNETDHAIVRSTVALAHSLDLQVIAEGVENAETLELLANIGCDQAQGYGLGKPLALEQAVRWLRRNAA